ncbi:condensation domain-containing protein [Rhizobium leguminosarum]|uniref:condensation domain-containing protein n=1 Tax=Rhizobium leguminosarum TaxID=384 RepID=UPI003F963D77
MSVKHASTVAGTKRFVRTLGAHERMLYLYSVLHPRHFCIVIEYGLPLTEEQLAQALRRLQACFPALSLCIMDYPTEGPALFETDNEIPLDFRRVPDGLGWQTVVSEELCRSFPTDGGPLLRATALSSHGSTTLVFTAHHALVDALSVITFSKRLGDILVGRPVDPGQAYSAMEDYLPRGQMTSSSADLDAITSRLKSQSEKPLWRDFVGDRVHVHEYLFDRIKTEQIQTCCRRHHVTVHGALCAALALTMSVASGRDRVTLANPVNIRGIAGIKADAVGLFVNVHTVTLEAGDKFHFWQLAKLVSDGLKGQKIGDAASAAAARLADLIRPGSEPWLAAGLIGSYSYDAVVSNLGVVPSVEERRPGDVESVRGPFVLGRLIDERTIGVSTYNGSLRLTQTSPQHIGNLLPELAEHLAANVAD